MTAPSVIQSFSIEGPNPPNTPVHTIAQAFVNKTGAGNTIVAFGTASDFDHIHNDSLFTDTANNTYVLKNQQDTNFSGGAASLWAHISQNIIGDPTTAANVTMGFNLGGDVEDFMSAFVLDIGHANVTSYVGVSGNTQNGLAPGQNNINSGPIVVGTDQVPCIMIACAINTSVSGGGSPTVNVGGLTLLANCWAFHSSPTIATIAYQNITVAGTYQALFDQSSVTSEDIAVIAIIVQGVSGVTIPDRFKFFLNGDIQAHAFVQGTLPAGVALRCYVANNTIHSANLVLTGAGHSKAHANGTLVCNNTIII